MNSSERQDNCKILSESSLYNIVKRLSSIIKEKRTGRQTDHLNTEWTKKYLIVPLLEGLGWDDRTDTICESGYPGIKGRLDLILNCQTPVGIEIRTLDELPPENIEHPQIKDGLRQCRAKKAPYFIWTNGDSWQFFSLALAKAAFYQVCLSKTDEDLALLDQLIIIKKDVFISDTDMFNKAIIKNTKLMALSHAWTAALQNHTNELLQVFRKGLKFVNVKDEVILKFLKTFKSDSLSPQKRSPTSFKSVDLLPHKGSSISFNSEDFLRQKRSPAMVKSDGRVSQARSSASIKPDGQMSRPLSSDLAPKAKNWERLINSYESQYRMARWFFQTSYYRKLGEYLISNNYTPWTKDSTWKHLGLSDGTKAEKKVRHAVALFQEWGFIEENGNDNYSRVVGCSPYLKKLLEKTPSQQ